MPTWPTTGNWPTGGAWPTGTSWPSAGAWPAPPVVGGGLVNNSSVQLVNATPVDLVQG
jgi:hypothetical protein